MTFNPALTYAEILSKSCFKCHMYLQLLLDSVSEFNGYYMVGDDIEMCVCVLSCYFAPS